MSNEEYSVLFVCTANRIRSVMAEALFREKLRANGMLGEWRLGSAGTWAGDGLRPMPMAVESMAARGIDISDHRSTPVDHVQLDSYLLILVMERGHQESLAWEFPEIAERVHLMSAMTDSAYEVYDPVAGTLRDHMHTVEMLDSIIDEGFTRIQELAADETQAIAE